ncbi:MAG: CopG family transcriptional regulator [Candidatus Methanomethylophilaceae archaeon]|nr:CopG family transcriptional regulator [Candidatus Methanomethylophilaceae archaeon]
MVIMSISLKDENVELLQNIQDRMGLGSRSEAIRVCLRAAESQLKEQEGMSGPLEGVLIIVHDSHMDSWMSLIQHRFERLVRTQLHSHLQSGKCLEVMILKGESDDIWEMIREFGKQEKAEYVKFVKS